MIGHRLSKSKTHGKNRPSLRAAARWIVLLFTAVAVVAIAACAAPAPRPTPAAPRPARTPVAPGQGGTPEPESTPAPRQPASSGSPSANKVSSSPQPAQDYNVRVTAKTLRYDDTNHFLTLDGNVVFTHLDTQITSPHAEFYTDKQIGYFTRGVRITQPGTTITSDKVSAFYAEKKAILTGRVEVVTEKVKSMNTAPGSAPKKAAPAGPTPKNPPASSLPTILLCNELDYWWEKQEGDAIGDVKIRQGDRRAFSDRAHYVGLEVRQVHMYSNVRYERGPDDWMTCEDAVIDMNTNVFTGNGNVEAYVKLQSTPSPAGPLTTPHGDRVLKPAPPVAPDIRRAPDGLPRPSDINKPSQGTEPAAPEAAPGESFPTPQR